MSEGTPVKPTVTPAVAPPESTGPSVEEQTARHEEVRRLEEEAADRNRQAAPATRDEPEE